MKPFFTLLALGMLLTAGPVAAQQKSAGKHKARVAATAGATAVPAAVQTAFAQQFPAAQKAAWGKLHHDYRVAFQQDGARAAALFAADGQLLQTQRTVPAGQLPPAAQQYLLQHYAKRKIRRVAQVEEAGAAMWLVDLNGQDILFDKTGHFLREESGKLKLVAR